MTNFEENVLNADYDSYHNENAFYGTKEEWESRFAEIRADERAKVLDEVKSKLQEKTCARMCYDAGVGNKDCLECDGTKFSIIDLIEILEQFKANK